MLQTSFSDCHSGMNLSGSLASSFFSISVGVAVSLKVMLLHFTNMKSIKHISKWILYQYLTATTTTTVYAQFNQASMSHLWSLPLMYQHLSAVLLSCQISLLHQKCSLYYPLENTANISVLVLDLRQFLG